MTRDRFIRFLCGWILGMGVVGYRGYAEANVWYLVATFAVIAAVSVLEDTR